MSVSLNKLLAGIVALPEGVAPQVMGLALDSRCVSPGDLFFARAGSHTHGAQFIHQAIARGAVAIVTENPVIDVPHVNIPIIILPNLTHHLGQLAARFYNYPTQSFTTMVGVTGTNGKTSITNLLGQILNCAATPCAIVGTLGYGFTGQLVPTNHTTPDAITLQGILATLAKRGARQLVMEVSSHALDQGRVAGIDFDIAIFTNLTRDHLDYHGNMAAYGRAKQRLFQIPSLQYAIINLDDEFGRVLSRQVPSATQVIGYGFSPHLTVKNDICATGLVLSSTGLRMTVMTPWGNGILESALLGRFNAANLLAVLATLGVRGMPLADALQALARVTTVPGRMETWGGGPAAPLVVVDYAHTPDALEQALLALREHTTGRLYCVFGCGGERDRGKRPLMGAVAQRLADAVIITNDNPRSEDAEDIIRAIFDGISTTCHTTIILDRAKAIHDTITAAYAGDVVLIAGKGHENYQQIGTVQLPFSDRREVMLALTEIL